ncbi:MAG: T9SS type A sorting domain-containing protein [bacterium]
MKLNLTISKEKSAMRKLTSFAAIGAFALLVTLISTQRTFAQSGLFNYVPYPTISLNQEDYYSDAQFLVPDALPGGERYFLVPVFIFNGVDPTMNPNTASQLPPGPGGRVFGVDGQFLEPIRSFEFQVAYPNQAIELDQNPAHGSPIMTVGPTKSSNAENTLASSFYFHYAEQSANDITNPYNRIIRVTAASEVPLKQTIPVVVDSSTVLCYLRFHVIPNWTVNTALLQLDTAKFADHLGDPQNDPNNYRRGNLGGHKDQIRGRLPVAITAQPTIELRPFSLFNTTDGKNYDLLPQFVFDPADPTANNSVVQLQIDNAQGSSRITNLNIVTDETWLSVGLTAGSQQKSIFFSSITNFNTQNQIIFDVKTMFISVNAAGLAPGVYTGHVTMTSDGASNSPLRLKVTLIVRAHPNESNTNGGSGIRLKLTNSCTPTCTTTIAFGTANADLGIPDASEGIDILYGETPFQTTDAAAALADANAAKHCYAYFQPLNPGLEPAYQQNPNLLGTTRDFRSRTADSTLFYKVVFNTGGPLCYPMSVCFDPLDLPDGARFVIRDIYNGSKFSYDMREATQSGNSKCVTISDANINAFIIEYTPARVGQTVALKQRSWNFLSLPVMPSDSRSIKVLPNAVGSPMAYGSNAGWTSADNLRFGVGYMARYSTVLDGPVNGARSLSVGDLEEVRVHEGWNAVGAASFPTCIEQTAVGVAPQTTFLTSVPGGPLTPSFTSDFFEYTPGRGYSSAQYLLPGHGYFVKVSDEADYHVRVSANCKAVAEPNAELRSELVKVSVRDADQNGQELYFGNVVNAQKKDFEMPASFTDFDARFVSTNGMFSPVGDQHTVKLASKNYPVAMNFDNVVGTVEIRDMSGKLIGTATNGGTVVIADNSVKSVVLSLKGSTSVDASGFALNANYPNPFGTLTSIGYTVPAETFVTITVTNALGQVVATPVNAVVAAGTHSVNFDASNLVDGTYFYTIHAGNFTQTEKMTVTK